MSADWQKGDLALCVSQGPHRSSSESPEGHAIPKPGGVYEVEAVLVHPFTSDLGLVLVGHHSTNPAGPARHSRFYRKLRPHTPDAEDFEVIEQLRKLPVKQPVSA